MGDTTNILTTAEDRRRSAGAEHSTRTLTRREREVLGLLASGLATRAMAEQLGVSSYTIRNHLRNIFTKISVHSRVQATAFAWRNGLL